MYTNHVVTSNDENIKPYNCSNEMSKYSFESGEKSRLNKSSICVNYSFKVEWVVCTIQSMKADRQAIYSILVAWRIGFMLSWTLQYHCDCLYMYLHLIE